MVEVGKDPIQLHKQNHLEQPAQDHVQMMSE